MDGDLRILNYTGDGPESISDDMATGFQLGVTYNLNKWVRFNVEYLDRGETTLGYGLDSYDDEYTDKLSSLAQDVTINGFRVSVIPTVEIGSGFTLLGEFGYGYYQFDSHVDFTIMPTVQDGPSANS